MYRRRIRIVTPEPGVVFGALEDSPHHVRVTVRFGGGRVHSVTGEAVRLPWTTCPGAVDGLASLAGTELTTSLRRLRGLFDPPSHCTHLFDLAQLTLAQAASRRSERSYDAVCTRTGTRIEASLDRDNEPVLAWSVENGAITEPAVFAGVGLTKGFLEWCTLHLDDDAAEAAFVLRRATTISGVAGIQLDDYPRALASGLTPGVCYTAQPDRIDVAWRTVGSRARLQRRGPPRCWTDSPRRSRTDGGATLEADPVRYGCRPDEQSGESPRCGAASGSTWVLDLRVAGSFHDALRPAHRPAGDRGQRPRPCRVGQLVLAQDFRHPAVLAKELATLDVFSGGRVEVGIGAGWMPADFEQSGIPFDSPSQRIERLEEALVVLKGLFREEPLTLAGKHFTITNLAGTPKPVQKPHPPIMIGGGGPEAPRGRGPAGRHHSDPARTQPGHSRARPGVDHNPGVPGEDRPHPRRGRPRASIPSNSEPSCSTSRSPTTLTARPTSSSLVSPPRGPAPRPATTCWRRPSWPSDPSTRSATSCWRPATASASAISSDPSAHEPRCWPR